MLDCNSAQYCAVNSKVVISAQYCAVSRTSKAITCLRSLCDTHEYWRVHLHDVDVRDEVADDVERIFREEGGCVRGYRFVHHVLVGERGGKPISEKIVRDVMRERGLAVIYRKKERRYSSYAGETDAGAPNIPLDEKSGRHDFRADAPNRKWVTDITEFKLPTGDKIYFSPVAGFFDSKPVPCSISLHPNSELADSSLLKACAALKSGEHPFCHSDSKNVLAGFRAVAKCGYPARRDRVAAS